MAFRWLPLIVPTKGEASLTSHAHMEMDRHVVVVSPLVGWSPGWSSSKSMVLYCGTAKRSVPVTLLLVLLGLGACSLSFVLAQTESCAAGAFDCAMDCAAAGVQERSGVDAYAKRNTVKPCRIRYCLYSLYACNRMSHTDTTRRDSRRPAAARRVTIVRHGARSTNGNRVVR